MNILKPKLVVGSSPAAFAVTPDTNARFVVAEGYV
jgi:hypothetical protein